MSCVFYKFTSVLKYKSITFNGFDICLRDLKYKIMKSEKLKMTTCDLEVTNAQTKEEYIDDSALIPKNTSVIVRRVPARGGKATGKTCATYRGKAKGVQLENQATKKFPSDLVSVLQVLKTANLAEASASEEDKIQAMMNQSYCGYDPSNYVKKPLGTPPPSHTCYRCGEPGHYRKNCPTNGAVEKFKNGTDYRKRLREETERERALMPPLPPPPPPLMAVPPPVSQVDNHVDNTLMF
ncbi:PREDICTED: E3 ubiquitin-protein ligase RBBP6-like [Mesitornis unicolor]|uniref:E3 ubiquitin-protein ligase RBBP6-like n=1 Tax=Mesitornis unicolor TaxID=54374 RepID=UPI000528D725|nr:PREDICTED: E3 ubiquitin-protein ligase RBBP6-like [Mesitornis unicolor]